MLLDDDGYLLWYMPVFGQNIFDFKYHPNTQQYSFIRYLSAQNAQYILLDPAFEPVDTFFTGNGVMPDPHEFTMSSNHTYLLSGVKDSTMDLSGYLFNGQPGSAQTNVIGFVIQEYDQQHNLIFEWNSNNHIHPSKAYNFYGYAAANFDYAHGNAIFEDTDGHLLLSFRNLNAVYKVARPGGNILWSLGGKSSSFTFPGGSEFSAQHDIRRLPNGNVSVFDNGNMAFPVKRSRAVEYTLDTLSWQAHTAWEYQPEPIIFSPAMGNHQTTEARNHLVNYGFVYRPHPSFELVDDEENLLTSLFFEDSVFSYRCFLQQTPASQLPRPEIGCSQTNGALTLHAPQGYTQYLWSTGATGSSITVSDAGEYQVWVNFGAGMLGSKPLKIEDVSTFCTASGTHAPVRPNADRRVSGIYDLLGRMVSNPVPGNLYVLKYNDGSAKIIMIQ